MSELEGRVAVVTGAAQGIGRAVATALGVAGARVALCDVVEPEAAAPAVTAAGPQASYHRCDVVDAEAVARTLKEIVEQHGGLHILVNNAGIAIDGLLLRVRSEDWEKVLRVNLTGAFNFAKAAAKYLLKVKEQGRIVNIASVVGEMGSTGQVAYAASKAALIGMTKTLAQELASRGVTVNAVSPGFIETRMTEQHVQGERREKLLASIPLGRIGVPQDVAAAVLFLCGDGAAYITGQVLRVNGGLYM
jgi:3-oxoacyl-[acyl-carrier protein] reductase